MYTPQGGVETAMKKQRNKAGKKKFEKQVLDRMSYIYGHLLGIQKMFENGKYCIDIIQQNEAVIHAIKKVNQIILKHHLNTCVTEAVKSNGGTEKKKKINELLEIFNKI